MARIEESVEIKRPVDQVFAYVVDAKTWSLWDSSILEAEQTSPGQMGIGTTFRGAIRAMGRRMAWTANLTEYEPNKSFSMTSTSGPIPIQGTYTFESVEGGTKVTLIGGAQFKGLLKLIEPIYIRMGKRELEGDHKRLKDLLEAQH